MMSHERPRRQLTALPWGRNAREQPGSGGSAERRRDATRGALLGLVLGERLNGAAPAGHLGTIAATALMIAERLSMDDPLLDGEFARLIIDHGGSDARYDRDLERLFAYWEAGMPLALAAFQVAHAHGGGGTDYAAAVLTSYALRFGDPNGLNDQARHAATIVDGDPVGVDAAAAFTAALAAALIDGDPLRAARRSAATPELRRALQLTATLAEHNIAAATLCEHLDTGPRAVDAIPTALYCAMRARTFADAIGDALDATTGGNAVPACTAAIAGARFGASAISAHLTKGVEPGVRERVDHIATTLAAYSACVPQSTATLS